MPTKMQNLLRDCLSVDEELSAAVTHSKLSADAFLELAIKNAETTPKRLDALAKALSAHEGYELAKAFIHRMSNIVGGPEFPSPPSASKFGKMARIYGPEDLAYDLHQLGFHTGELVALAVRNSIAKYPEKFGDVVDLESHNAHVAELKDKRESLLQGMADAITGPDIELHKDGAVISGTSVPLSVGWQERLLAFAQATPAKKKRERIAA